MIPQVEERDVQSSAVDDTTSFDISQDDVAWIMTILRDTLYSDKILAVLREYGTNAWDANAMAGKGDVPIRVTMPTLGSPELIIRDDGPGLSHEDIGKVYTKYGASTKRNSNDGAGMLGIGSKSGFAYSDSFTITSWNGGMKRIYVAVLSDARGRCDLLHSEPCDPAETGVEIKIAVKPQDIPAFESRAIGLFANFVPRPKINLTIPEGYQGYRTVGDLGKIDEKDDYSRRGLWFAQMGPIAYKIDLTQLDGNLADSDRLSHSAHGIGGVLPFPIGSLRFAASRESLKYDDGTKRMLRERINAIIDEYVRLILSDIDDVSDWEKRIRVNSIQRKGLPLPPRLKHLSGTSIDLKTNPNFSVATRNYKNRMTPTTWVSVANDVRFVVRDEKKKATAGYSFREHDYLVSPTQTFHSASSGQLVAELKRSLKTASCEGATIILLTSLPWNPPTDKKTGKPRDALRAKSKSFVLDPTKPFYDDTRSESWTPIERFPQDSDVFVVLESYRVENMEGFYNTFRNDEKLLKELGMTMPKIYGYKTTKAKPAIASNLKGIEYRKWRNTLMADMLLKDPKVAELANVFDFISGWRHLDRPLIEKTLGKDHVLSNIAAMEESGKIIFGQADSKIKTAVNHVINSNRRNLLDSVKRVEELKERYTLLKAVGLDALKEQNKELWLEYIQLVDKVNAMADKAEKKEAA